MDAISINMRYEHMDVITVFLIIRIISMTAITIHTLTVCCIISESEIIVSEYAEPLYLAQEPCPEVASTRGSGQDFYKLQWVRSKM